MQDREENKPETFKQFNARVPIDMKVIEKTFDQCSADYKREKEKAKKAGQYYDTQARHYDIVLFRTDNTVKRETMREVFEYHRGSGIKDGLRIEELLSCLQSDARSGEEDFQEFCANYGYNEDSRQAERTWRACQENGQKLQKVLGEFYDDLMQCEED